MDALADILQPYKEVIGSVAAIVTMGQMFSGSFICYDIYKQKSTNNIGIMPFVGGMIFGILNLAYGYILREVKMIQVNLAGLALSVAYLTIYFYYTAEKAKAWSKLGLGLAFSAVVIGYVQYEDPELIETRFGLIMTMFMFFFIASPLFDLKRIIKTKSTEGMPFPVICYGTLTCFMWLLYGITLRNTFIVLQNVFVLMICGAQLSLFVIYPSKPRKEKASKTEAKKEN